MSQLTLSTLVHQLGPSNVTGFFLVLARVAPLFVLAPLFSSAILPSQVKTVVAVGLSMGLTGVAMRGQTVPSDPLTVAGMLVAQMLVGLAFAFAVNTVFSAVEAAGSLLDVVSGFSYGQLIDPVNNSSGGVLSALYGMVGLAMFLAIGGDAWTLRGLARTFQLVPLTRAPSIASLTSGVEQAFSSIFVSAIEIAAPALLALLITDIAFGMIAKVVPQISIFSIGFPLKIGVALLTVAAAVPFLGNFMSGQIATAVGTALHSIVPG